MKLKLSAIVALALASSVSLGAAEKLTTSTINVYSPTPLPSFGLPLNIIPANIQIATPKAINSQAGVSLADYMNNNMQSVSTTEMGGNPWQPEITFRGFSASPLLGMPQGISTYLDGVRVNEPFGDVTLWDKIPNFAIGGMQLIPGSNPLYGLNTLGGAIAIQTKSGREAKGAAAEFEAGSWNRQRYLAEYGGVSKDGSVDYYIGHQTTKEEGWRQFSPSRLKCSEAIDCISNSLSSEPNASRRFSTAAVRCRRSSTHASHPADRPMRAAHTSGMVCTSQIRNRASQLRMNSMVF